ncbi:hypothetical protein CHLRE_06g281600v5 [Chlamydomonas reinhardtii]|uniref:Uncharacterized protein n=1 Tax=Chlamydomonas reinhardtii TaxID=3055 RepID=A8J225_CHLRE|nr:uncharacterized protein CHLRE_06g281600v5 [Chlamydomonas reinhardtii]PNW82504.1 hypothetical protein CHLRE_06g281600v5 [Chlamydomonas reinhardtii]|eukprot:XP_001695444.1 low-CO2-inducible protein [Chlamydomonas reinhardtii]
MGARVESIAADSVCAPVAFSLSGRASSDASATSSLGVELGLPVTVPGKQLERQVYFNILVAGQSNLGKSRFIASLADTFGTDGANKRPARSSSSGLGATGRSASATLDRHARELQTHLTPLALPGRPGRQLHTMLQDTQGHGSENNKTVHLSKLLEHLLRQREADYRAARSGGCCGGAGEPPALPHSLSLCLYFLPPTEVSALDLAYMSALSQEVPLLPVLVPQPDAPEQAGGGPVSAERLAALRRSLVAAMAAYTRDGKAAPIVPLALDPEAVDALLQQQPEEEGEEVEVEALEQARQAAAGSGGDNGARRRRRGSASSLSVLVLGDGAAGGAAAAGSLQRPDAALLRRLLDCSVEPVMRSAAERFTEFCERYEMYGNDLMFMLSERMEPYGKVIRAAEAADAEVAARRQQAAAAAAAAAKGAGLLEAKAAAHGVAESGVIHVIVRDASLTITEHADAGVIAHDAAHTAAEHAVTQSAMAAAPSSHATKRGHDSLQGSAADADTEDAYRHAARPRAVTPALAAASPFSVFATDAASAAAAASDSCGAVARSSTPQFAAPPATADAFATPLPPRPPSPEPEHCGEGQGDVERVVSAIEEIVTQLSRSLEGSGSDGEHGSAGVLPRGASTTALGARFGTLAEDGEEEAGDVGMAEAEEEVAGGAEWEDGAVVGEAAVVGVDQVEMHAAVEEEEGAAAPAPATAAGVFAKLASTGSGKLLASMASAGSGKLLASVASVRRYWSRSLDGSAPEARSDSDVAATASADAPAAAGTSGAWPAAVARYVPATATSAAVGVGLMGLAAGTAAVVLLQRSRSAAITA